ncbi:MAG: hypothetical protein M1817_000406 [Caeruleum heppii]|nr:MAG: hypothetical protein M1817_000406 [Caeruleum heppii]
MPVADFPTNIHLDLLSHGLIPDPFIAKNEAAAQWVGEKAWIYRTSFTLSPTSLKSQQKAVLAFDGLDTYATVTLNGHVILKTQNMFLPERVDVTKLLKEEGDNDLIINFESAFLIGKKIQEDHPEHKWLCWNGHPSRLAVRKAQYHYGWDWGPTLLTCGPWRPIGLEIYETRIAHLSIKTDLDKLLTKAEVTVKADIEGPATKVRFHISLRGNPVAAETVTVEDSYATVSFQTKNPELWYPTGYGKQPLYFVTVTVFNEDVDCDVVQERFGIRRAEVVQEPLSGQKGKSFFFRINNIPIFCGGSNWIPIDSFIPRTDRRHYSELLSLLADGNQNMVRVWAGGIYEEPAFYSACDELGILVWQDFMFACGNYPAFPGFLASIEQEARANVKILRHHPSIVVWAGNNEDYQIMESERLDYDRSETRPARWLKSSFPARYIYEKLLVDVMDELAPDTYYHFGSPFGGDSTRDPCSGDIHQWNVWHEKQEKYQDYDKLSGRFVSEFGMQALPHIKTIDNFLSQGKNERFAQSSTMDFHNKAAGHERRLATYLVENIRYSFEPLEAYIYATQLIQAECLGSAFRQWRRQWQGPSKEFCGGALAWQLNDCWPGTSWAMVDYYLRPKLAYWVVKRELAPITVGMKRTGRVDAVEDDDLVETSSHGTVALWASNSSITSRQVEVEIKAWDLESGAEMYSTRRKEVELGSNRSIEIADFEVPTHQTHERRGDMVVVAAWITESGKQLARHVNWPEPLKYLPLQRANIQAELSADTRQLQLSTDVPVKGLSLEIEASVTIEDNCIDLVPGETVCVGVKNLYRKDGCRLKMRYLNHGEEQSINLMPC